MFDDHVVEEYIKKNKDSNGSYDWWEFLNEKSDLPTSLAFAKIFCPEIKEVEGCYVLKNRYEPKLFNDWKASLNQDFTALEKITNVYEIGDFFTENIDYSGDYSEMIDSLGKALQYYWQLTLKDRYPNIPFVVDLYDDYEYETEGKEFAALCITIYVDRSK